MIIIEDDETEMWALSSHSRSCQILKGPMKNTSMLTKLYGVFNIYYSDSIEGILHFIKKTDAADKQLLANLTEQELLSIEGFAQLEIAVTHFQETNRFQIHQACSTRTKAFHNCGPRNNWVWVKTSREAN